MQLCVKTEKVSFKFTNNIKYRTKYLMVKRQQQMSNDNNAQHFDTHYLNSTSCMKSTPSQLLELHNSWQSYLVSLTSCVFLLGVIKKQRLLRISDFLVVRTPTKSTVTSTIQTGASLRRSYDYRYTPLDGRYICTILPSSIILIWWLSARSHKLQRSLGPGRLTVCRHVNVISQI